MKNITDLRKELITAFGWIKKSPKRGAQVKTMVLTAGRILDSVKTEIAYASIRKEVPNIPFLKNGHKL